MFFSSGPKIGNAEYNLPKVIYGMGEHRMRIYVYKDDTPGKDTLSYVAPFFNMIGSSVCLGSTNIDLLKNPTYEGLLQY